YEKAMRDFDWAIQLNPKNTTAYYDRAYVWRDKKEFAKAAEQFKEVVRIDPTDAQALDECGLVWRSAKEYDKAINEFRQAIRLDAKFAYPVIFGHFTAREAGNDLIAKQFVTEAQRSLEKSAWPYPVIKFLSGEIDEAALLKQATDVDKQTEA